MTDVDRFRQDIVFSEVLRDQRLTFHTTWGLFSPKAVDEGSRLLLDHVEVKETDACMDLGCGYGPIGLTLARLAPKGRVTLVDKDFVAVEYAQKNMVLNGVDNAEVLLSNGFGQVPSDRRFDVIVSNLPAKVGGELLAIFLHDARRHLNPGGCVYVVTISGLRRYIERNFKDIFGDYKKLKQGRQYTVARACLS